MKMEPCKYCGKTPMLMRDYGCPFLERHRFHGYFVACVNRKCPESPLSFAFKDKDDAVADWNKMMKE